MNEILLAFLISFGLQTIFFLIAYFLQTDKFTDFTYSLTFITIALYFYLTQNLSLIVFLMILLWGLRLGGFLVLRVIKVGKDRRFDDFRHKFFGFIQFWIVQGFTCFILLLPIYLFTELNYYGIIIFLIGLLIETIADYQKYRFKLVDKKKGFIHSGIWKHSRHPNYFGEILVWVGIFVATINTNWYISILSPITIYLILRYFSGVRILEENALKKWGKDKNYQKYLKNTNMFVPVKKLF